MRVLLIGDHPPPLGGISVHVSSLRSLLVRAGFEVRVLDVSRPAKPADPPGVTVARGIWHALRTIAAAARQGFLVHAHVSGHNGPSWAVAAGATWAARPFGPSLLTVHSGLAPDYLARRGHRLRARFACAPAARILCANDDVCRALRRCDVRPGRLEVLPAFLEAGDGEAALPEAAAGLRESCPRILAAALGEGPEYGADLLAASWKRLAARRADLGLCVFGRGATPALAHALGERALCLGEIPHGQALAVLSSADLVLRPSRADGDSVTVREALARGVRVVATAVVRRPAGVKLAEPEPEAFAAAVLSALDEGGREAARVPSADRQLLQLYRHLAAPAPRLELARQAV